MTLLITTFAACIATAVWYKSYGRSEMKPGILALIYWGASIMWFVDAFVEYMELKSEYFTPAPADMLNDSFLGFSVVALGLIIWLVFVMIKDPKGVIRKSK